MNNQHRTMQRHLPALAAMLILAACNKEACMQCIVENDRGLIIETRVYCEANDRAREGFADGVKERYAAQPDTVHINCRDFEYP